MTVEGKEDLQGLRQAGRVVANCLRLMSQQMEEGMRTEELDAIGAAYLEEQGAESAPQITYDFPGATCISVNEEAAHGIPGARILQRGDMVNIDVSARLDGYFADTGATFVLGQDPDERQHQLLQACEMALEAAMRVARAGRKIRLIGRSIERVARHRGFDVIRNLGSHGVGRSLHDEPGFIPGYDEPRERRKLGYGQVITIEPFLTTGGDWVEEADDGWTQLNNPGSMNAQFEHTMVITRGEPMIMTMP